MNKLTVNNNNLSKKIDSQTFAQSRFVSFYSYVLGLHTTRVHRVFGPDTNSFTCIFIKIKFLLLNIVFLSYQLNQRGNLINQVGTTSLLFVILYCFERSRFTRNPSHYFKFNFISNLHRQKINLIGIQKNPVA